MKINDALGEWLNACAVMIESVNRGGGDSAIYYLQARTLASIIAINHTASAEQILDAALARANHIFSSGQDWRRERKLYGNYNRRMYAGEVYINTENWHLTESD